MIDNDQNNSINIIVTPQWDKKKLFPIGTQIKSSKVGIKEEFYGSVIDYTQHEVIVRDYKDGTKWVRSVMELTIVEGNY